MRPGGVFSWGVLVSQRKSAAVALGITALLAPSLTACSSTDESDNQAVCVDKTTEERVPDSQCDPGDGANIGVGGIFFWYFLATRGGAFFPGIGQRVSGGTYAVPHGTYTRGGVPSAGGNVPRGGFGGGTRARTSGGG
jgi:hypothetical protein